jgi:pantoate--beta-alanine ligase
MIVAKSQIQLQDYLKSNKKKSIGFVPTMGALHKGHLSLVSKSNKNNDLTIVSIFVNPTQFDKKADLEKYPNLLEQDLKTLKKNNVDLVYLPDFAQIYPDNFTYKLSELILSKKYCGASRQGHFDGVLTIVMKLLNLVEADIAYFGKKDYQQLSLIKGMVKAFFMPVKIVSCDIVREKDGLAMSSRNLRLTQQQRVLAPKFYQILKANIYLEEKKRRLTDLGFVVDYLEVLDKRLLGAVFLGEIRLIDNVKYTQAMKQLEGFIV